MQCAHAILPSVACLAVQYLPTLSHKKYDFRKEKFIEPKMCVFIFSTALCKKNLILRRNERDIIINLHIGLHVKYLLFLSALNET